jgi:hypothetical protein
VSEWVERQRPYAAGRLVPLPYLLEEFWDLPEVGARGSRTVALVSRIPDRRMVSDTGQ